MTPIIEIKNVGKQYLITNRLLRYRALRDSITENLRHPITFIQNSFRNLLGKNQREVFWALRGINLTIEKGETVGIIGANGAGKSTLLKILSQITPPSEGEIVLRGKVASLLEVGTGFHPELTGRENIYLNGAILGMTRREINKKFDAIVNFAGLEQFIDTPVKRYSSGMYVRLAFSVAAHIEPDILLVDEVLAVGDAEFQKKSLGKMEEVSGKAGRTILFVSHNMAAIEKLCKKAVLLSKGKIVATGNTKEVIEYYLKNQYDQARSGSSLFPFKEHDVVVHNFTLTQSGVKTENVDGDKSFEIEIDFETLEELTQFRIGVYVRNILGDVLFRSCISDWRPELEKIAAGRFQARLVFPEKTLRAGNYFLSMHVSRYGILNYMVKRGIEKAFVVGPSAYYNQAHPTEKPDSALLLNKLWSLEAKT